jgi:hypothetical protein
MKTKKKTKKKTSRGLDPSSLSSRAFSSAKSPTVCASPNTAPGALFPPKLPRTIRTSERIQSSLRREDVLKVTPRKDFAFWLSLQTKNSSLLKRFGRTSSLVSSAFSKSRPKAQFPLFFA